MPETNARTNAKLKAKMDTPNSSKKPTLIVIAVLLLWAVLLAIGATVKSDTLDFRKPLVVLGTIGTFAGIWLFALSRKKD